MTQNKPRVLTEAFVRALPPKAADYYVSDVLVPPLKVRVRPSGHKSYILRRRLDPRAASASSYDLGAIGEISLADARQKAREGLQQIKQGIDPREAARAQRDNTLGSALELFLQRHVAGQRKAKELERELRRELGGRWANRPLSSVTRKQVIQMIDEIKARAPGQARNVLINTKVFFGWCVEKDMLPFSPTDHISTKKQLGPKVVRSRVLDDNELRALWNAADTLGYPLGSFLKMLLLTGQRRSEVAMATWDEFDLTNKRWTIPAERYKVKAEHIVPLTDAVLALLATLPRTGDYLFSNAGRSPLRINGKTKDVIDAAVCNIKHWTLHDLRRTCRTRLSELRVPENIAELCIGHASKNRLVRTYNLYHFQPEMLEAFTAWAARLQEIVAPRSPNVVNLKRL